MEGHENHSGEKLKKNEKRIVIILTIITIICGVIGFKNEERSFFDALYLTAQLFIIHSGAHEYRPNAFLELARWLGAGLAIYAVIKLYMLLISQSIKSWFFKKKDHVIIIGYNELALRIIKDLPDDYIILIGKTEKNLNTKLTNRHLLQFDTEKLDQTLLNQAGISYAREIYILGDKDDENISVGNDIMHHIIGKEQVEITLWIRIDDKEKLRFYKHFHQRISPGNNSRSILNIHAFNLHEITAQRLVDDNSPDKIVKILADAPALHTAVIGDAPIARYLFEESLNMYHFLNLTKNIFTWVSDAPEIKRDDFHFHFPDIQMTGETHFREFDDFFSSMPDDLSLCYLCNEDYIQNILLGLRIRSRYFQNNKNLLMPDIICLVSDIPALDATMPDLIAQCEKARLTLIDLETYCSVKQMINIHHEWDKIALAIHNTYNNLPQADAVSAWSALSDAEKDQNRYPARHLRVKLRSMGFDIDYDPAGKGEKLSLPDDMEIKMAIAKMEHNRWMAQKILDGFTSVKDRANFPRVMKTVLLSHPDIVPFDDLSTLDIEKDWVTYPKVIETSKIKIKEFEASSSLS